VKEKMVWIMVLVSFCLIPVSGFTQDRQPVPGDEAPDIRLTAPDAADHREYLGITDQAAFSLSEIQADVIIVEIFSMYCPICQKEAGRVNELYEQIQSNSLYRDKIRLIGIGAGNSEYEVSVFRDNYSIPFPLFPDGDFAIHKKLGETRTPYFFAIKRKEDGSGKVIFAQLGGFKNADRFLDTIAGKAGIK
jgi:peroxiredoxin